MQENHLEVLDCKLVPTSTPSIPHHPDQVSPLSPGHNWMQVNQHLPPLHGVRGEGEVLLAIVLHHLVAPHQLQPHLPLLIAPALVLPLPGHLDPHKAPRDHFHVKVSLGA